MSERSRLNHKQRSLFLQVCDLLARPVIDSETKTALCNLIKDHEHILPFPFLPPIVPVYDLFHSHLVEIDFEFENIFSETPEALKDQEARIVHYFKQKRDFEKLYGVLENEKVNCMLIKGAALESLYQSGFVRSASDRDLVFADCKRTEIFKLLQKNNWRKSSNPRSSSWYHIESSAAIDLHEANKPLAKRIFDRAKPINPECDSILLPNKDDHLLITAMHNIQNPSKKIWRDLSDIRALKLGGASIERMKQTHRYSLSISSNQKIKSFINEQTGASNSDFQHLGALDFSPLYFEYYKPITKAGFLPHKLSGLLVRIYRENFCRKSIQNYDPFFEDSRSKSKNFNRPDSYGVVNGTHNLDQISTILSRYKSLQKTPKIFSDFS